MEALSNSLRVGLGVRATLVHAAMRHQTWTIRRGVRAWTVGSLSDRFETRAYTTRWSVAFPEPNRSETGLRRRKKPKKETCKKKGDKDSGKRRQTAAPESVLYLDVFSSGPSCACPKDEGQVQVQLGLSLPLMWRVGVVSQSITITRCLWGGPYTGCLPSLGTSSAWATHSTSRLQRSWPASSACLFISRSVCILKLLKRR